MLTNNNVMAGIKKETDTSTTEKINVNKQQIVVLVIIFAAVVILAAFLAAVS